MSDNEIVQLVLAGNRDAFRAIAEKYQGMVFRTCIGFVHNKEDAEDITQETFIQVCRHVDQFREDSQLYTWIYTIAKNLC